MSIYYINLFSCPAYRKTVCTVIFLVVLSGCTMTKGDYDIDVECITENMRIEDNEKIKTFGCLFPSFQVNCDFDTVQYIEQAYLCSTKDGKSVRIKLDGSGL